MKVRPTPGLDLAKYNRAHDFTQIRHTQFTIDSLDWRQTHGDNEKALTEALEVLAEAIHA